MTYRKFCYLVQRFLLGFSQMEIIISDIPIEGLHLSGKFSDSIFDLDPKDSIRCDGDVHYSVDIYSFDEAVVFSGKLQGPFELQCGICLEFFPYQANFPNWNSELELEEGQRTFHLQEIIREDFLLHLPTHPRCDEDGARKVCPKADFVLDEEEQEPLEESVPPMDDVWNELDKLK